MLTLHNPEHPNPPRVTPAMEEPPQRMFVVLRRLGTIGLRYFENCVLKSINNFPVLNSLNSDQAKDCKIYFYCGYCCILSQQQLYLTMLENCYNTVLFLQNSFYFQLVVNFCFIFINVQSDWILLRD